MKSSNFEIAVGFFITLGIGVVIGVILVAILSQNHYENYIPAEECVVDSYEGFSIPQSNLLSHLETLNRKLNHIKLEFQIVEDQVQRLEDEMRSVEDKELQDDP